MLNPELAEKIVNEVRKLIVENVIVVNTEGTIIASTDPSRVGAFHEGALIAADEQRKLIITKEDEQKLAGVKEGINFPVFFQNDVIGIVGITGDPSTVTPFGEIIRKMTELLISENHYSSQFDWQSRAIEAFVMDWLQSSELNGSLADRARLLGISLELERRLAILEFRDMSAPLSREIWSSILINRYLLCTDLITRWGNNRIVLLLDATAGHSQAFVERKLQDFCTYLQSLTGFVTFAGVGQAVAPTGLYDSYSQAGRALNISGPDRPIVFDEDLTLEMILDSLNNNLKKEFISRTIGPLLDDQDLLDTLREFLLQNQSMKQAASSLHIHINTLHYRLKKIEELTGLATGKTADLAALYLAMTLLDKHTKNTAF
ncbi:CdaR family transcriptional regulator [Bacillus sp. B-jedd]|uniref:CdaR family transcriptional regulator n=1 Tax=Bacillus sp. B-jedd TaxID=1476857 RepID=UPI0005156D82|nr:sugar diacid recognition domain-containing protein [Bacillus sp. B-jedd]CEG26594.1 transcriptional regulator CdaR [Bacillus sp. B-jedd]